MSGSPAQRADLRHYLEPYWRRRWLVLVILIVIPAAVFGASKLIDKKYEASTTLLVRSTNFSSQAFTTQIAVQTGSAAAAAQLVQTTPVARAAAAELDEPPASAGSLLSGISVDIDDTDTSSQFMTITAEFNDPDRAADVANAFATAITKTRTDDAVADINETIETLQAQADKADKGGDEDQAISDELDAQLQQLQGLRASQSGTTQVIERAAVPGSPVSPKPLRNTALGLVLAILLAAGIVPLADRLNRKLRDPDELAAATGEQVLATIPEAAFPGHPPSPAAREAFQTLRAGLRYFNLDRSLTTVVITSPLHADGKTTVATNTALAMARDGQNVVLLDGDLRRPRAAQRLGLEGTHSLEAVLVDGLAIDEALADVDAGGGRLRVLASTDPSPNPAALLSSERMQELLAELGADADVVIIDTPPLLVVADAIPLLAPASGIVLVSRINQTGMDAVNRSAGIISAAGGRLLGNVVTGASGSRFDYYGYGYGDNPDAEVT